MTKYDYNQLIQSMINLHFKELKKYKIKLTPSIFLKKTFMITLPFSNNIFYNLSLIDTCNLNVLKAVLIHELCHITQFKRKNFLQKLFFIPKYHIDDNFRINHELEAHENVVKIGYGNELIELNYFVKKRYPPKVWNDKLSKYYLSKENIHKIMKNCEQNYDN